MVAGSPAIDAVNDDMCPPPARDQREETRPQDGNGNGGPACDIDAYEFVFTGQIVQAPQEPVALPSVVPDPVEPVIPDPVTSEPQQTDTFPPNRTTPEPVSPEPVSADQEAAVTCWGISPFKRLIDRVVT